MKTNLLTLLLLTASTLSAQQRQETELADNWQFSQDQQQWQTVSVPHDWAISGPFDKKWDLQIVAITQNGEKEATEKSGRSGALPWIGEGHYKRTFQIPDDFKGHAELVFDGAMAEPAVSVNGQPAGYWAYGYNTFRLDITQLVRTGENLLSVDLKNVEESSRWYPGAGIYRPVTLVLTPAKTYIEDWSTFVRTKTLDNGKGGCELECDTRIANADSNKKLRLSWYLYDSSGKEIAVAEGTVRADGTAHQRFSIKKEEAQLWTPETPYLYKVKLCLWQEGRAT